MWILEPTPERRRSRIICSSSWVYVEPVIWNRQTGNVVGGHQRLKVLIDLGQQEIDCVVVDLDLQREKALNIALNKIQGD